MTTSGLIEPHSLTNGENLKGRPMKSGGTLHTVSYIYIQEQCYAKRASKRITLRRVWCHTYMAKKNHL